MQRQLTLFGRDQEPGFDPAFARARRSELADGAWVEEVPGWVRGHERLFDLLERGTRWRSIPKVAAAGPRISIMFRPTWYPG